ncbi:hypothetical protein [Frankia sp. AgB32]|uniref:hypothetical protein n=1 Tax=Frankia sp. AgB32 TaxID=631119 RepID=UPI00200F9A94|nr:hypothetical protein [Frankia sp. AgB32]MCK9896965.1 hypothetical protein [Frankia sp. AgB32]
MTAFADKIRSVGYLRGGRTRPRVREGRAHPDSGVPFKAVTDELGGVVTEHATRDDRVDVTVHAPRLHVQATQTEER